MHAHEFLKALTIVLSVAAVTTVLFQKLKQPVVLGYILAGLIVGPHVPVPLVADREVVQTLSELGVILLMFSLGLDFSLKKLVQVGPTAGITAVIQCCIMMWLGFLVGRLFGWTLLECLFTGAIIAISSTTIIAKAFDEQGIRGKLRELVVGILIVEDLIAILLMTALTALSSKGDLSTAELARSTGRLLGFLVLLLAAGLLIVPRTIRAIVRLKRAETILVASIGLCFAISLLASTLGYSVALGAFIAGSLIAESGEAETVERLIEPVRDMFAAIFFVSVGMLLDPALVGRYWVPVAVLTSVVVLGKILSVSSGAFLAGNGLRTSVQAGMSLAQIGEFSFIIAGLGMTLKATGDFLYPVAVAVSVVTTVLTPWLIRAADPVAHFVDRTLPAPLQTFTCLYSNWIQKLKSAPGQKTAGGNIRRLIRLIVLDAGVLATLLIGASFLRANLLAILSERLGLSSAWGRTTLLGGLTVLAAPFIFGLVRSAQRLGGALAETAFPSGANGKTDLALAPRRMLVVTLQLLIVLLVGLPLLVLTQPFLPGATLPIILGLLLVVLGIAFWRSATNLEGHVQAGAGTVLEALLAQARRGASPDTTLTEMKKLLPGLGDPTPVRLKEASFAIGKTLADLNLRGQTGATALAILRGDQGILAPTAHEVLKRGDVLALAGSREAVETAKSFLESPSENVKI